MTNFWSTPDTGGEPAAVQLPCGDAMTWSVTLPGVSLPGYTALWLLGTPPQPALLGLPAAPVTAPAVLVTKTPALLVIGSDTQLRFSIAATDTASIAPGLFWQQAQVIDPQGNPYTVDEGPVLLTPSLAAIRLTAAA
ncbi:hypothetical protein [Methylobacterium sp. 1030]|uniref:hypothetical protein n=1 Tax=Methylobacterium sp. 1030 TaxID=3156404 RepID=UPI0033956B8A